MGVDPREVAFDLRGVVQGLIRDAFRSHELRFKPERGMAVSFRLRDGSEVQLLLWSPMNYVGVFARFRKQRDWTPWEARSYHDSGWTEGVDRLVNEHVEMISGMGLHGMKIVKLTGDECQTLRRALRERDL